MTFDEAAETGRLVESLLNVRMAIRWSKNKDRSPLDMGIGVAEEYCEAGSSGPNLDAVVGQAMVIETLEFLRSRIEARLIELGVEP